MTSMLKMRDDSDVEGYLINMRILYVSRSHIARDIISQSLRYTDNLLWMSGFCTFTLASGYQKH